MPSRRRVRVLPALAGAAAVATVVLVALGGPAWAHTKQSSDGSAGRPKSASGGLLGLQVDGDLGIQLNVGPIHVDTTKLLGGQSRRATTGHSAHPAPPPVTTPSPLPTRSPSGGSSRPPAPPSHPRRKPAHRAPAPRTRMTRREPTVTTAVVRTVAHRTGAAHHPSSHLRSPAHRRSSHRHTARVASRRRHDVASSLFDPVRPGSPAQILMLLVLMCGIGTALVVSLARRKDPKVVRVEASDRRH